MNNSLTSANPRRRNRSLCPPRMTAVTGLVDAVSFLSLGSVFTANMTGNIFNSSVCDGACVWTVRGALFNGAHSVCMGAILGGRITARASAIHGFGFAAQAFLLEVVFLSAGRLQHRIQKRFAGTFPSTACSDRLHGLAMGTRNAVVRKLAIPDLTTTVLTLTVTGIAADSFTSESDNPRFGRGELVQSWQSFSGQRLVQSSYATRSQRRSRLRPQFPSRAVLALFRSLRRPDKLERRACFLGRGVVPDSNSATVQTTVAEKSSTVSNTIAELSALERQRFPRPL